jgi:hypothetical protein
VRLHSRFLEADVANAASEGIEKLVALFDIDGRKNVDFDRSSYRKYVERVREDETRAALAAALTVESPEKRAGGLQGAPLVMMFGQGHQNFLERLVAVPRGDLPSLKPSEKLQCQWQLFSLLQLEHREHWASPSQIPAAPAGIATEMVHNRAQHERTP